jgi:hypothetical protein
MARRQEEGNAKTQRRKDAKGRKENRKGMEKEGDGDGRGWVLVFPCAFAPLHLCVHFFPAFHSDPRFIPIRVSFRSAVYRPLTTR